MSNKFLPAVMLLLMTFSARAMENQPSLIQLIEKMDHIEKAISDLGTKVDEIRKIDDQTSNRLVLVEHFYESFRVEMWKREVEIAEICKLLQNPQSRRKKK